MQRLESRVERWESAVVGKVLPAEPVELLGALRRECDKKATVLSEERTLVPNAFTVELDPEIHDRLGDCSETLCQQLTDVLLRHAKRRGYEFSGPLAVRLARTEGLPNGRYRVSGTPARHLRSGAVCGVVDAAARSRLPRRPSPATA